MAGPSFEFRLERVRALRERSQKLAERELALAIGGRCRSEQELHAADEHLVRAQSEQREAASATTLDAGDMRARQAYLERVEAQRGQRKRELELSSEEVARRDAQLTAAATEHQMLKRLRERDRSAHDRDAARREQVALDEIAAVRFRRSAGS